MARTSLTFTDNGSFEFTPRSDETRINGSGNWGVTGVIAVEEYVNSTWVALGGYTWSSDYTSVMRLVPERLHRVVLTLAVAPNLIVATEDLFVKERG